MSGRIRNIDQVSHALYSGGVQAISAAAAAAHQFAYIRLFFPSFLRKTTLTGRVCLMWWKQAVRKKEEKKDKVRIVKCSSCSPLCFNHQQKQKISLTCLPPNDGLRLAHLLHHTVDAVAGNAVHLKEREGEKWGKESRIANENTIDKTIRMREGERKRQRVAPNQISQSATETKIMALSQLWSATDYRWDCEWVAFARSVLCPR